jgi:hypothetical protein
VIHLLLPFRLVLAYVISASAEAWACFGASVACRVAMRRGLLSLLLLVFGFGIDNSTLLGERPVPDCCVAMSRTGWIKCSALTTPAEVATVPNLS